MLYRQKRDVFIRNYGNIGYIINTRNGSDRVVDAVGAVFLSALSKSPKDTRIIASEIGPHFIDADNNKIEQDIIDFYAILEQDGFIVSGETSSILDTKDKPFIYSSFEQYSDSTSIQRSAKNTLEYFNEYFSKDPRLMSFQIELTNRCNERCIHCYIPHENRSRDIDQSLFYDVLEQAVRMGVIDITLSGGEPFYHPLFCDFLRKTRDHDIIVIVLSNLTLLDNEIIAELKNTHIRFIQTSLYALDSHIHDSITKMPGSFEKTMNAINKLIENDIPVSISCPIMKNNKDAFGKLRAWASAQNINIDTDYIMMARSDHSTKNLTNRLSLEEVKTHIRSNIENDGKFQNEMLKENFDLLDKKDMSDEIVCGAGFRSACMAVNGDINPCPGWQSYIVGNAEKQPLDKIWINSPELKHLRSIRRKDFPQCLTCKDRSFCMLCLVRNANENPEGDMFKINEHFCKVAALNRKIVFDWKAKLRTAQ